MTKLLEPIYPGEILLEDFMKPLGVSINKLARDIDVPPGRISDVPKSSGSRHPARISAPALRYDATLPIEAP